MNRRVFNSRIEGLSEHARRQIEAAERAEFAAETPPPEPLGSRKSLPKSLPQVNEGEELFALQLRGHGVPFEREYVFHQSRRWRFDFAIVGHLVAIEIEGAIWKKGGGGHSHPSGIESDIEKYNAAAADGWRVFRFMPDKHVESGTGIEQILNVLDWAR